MTENEQIEMMRRKHQQQPKPKSNKPNTQNKPTKLCKHEGKGTPSLTFWLGGASALTYGLVAIGGDIQIGAGAIVAGGLSLFIAWKKSK